MYVELKNINKSFKKFKAADNVNFEIEKGKLIGLLGPSGSGKTTILRMIAGLETPDGGDIIIDGRRVNDIDVGKRGIGFVFQNYALFRYMTVYENIAFGLKVKKADKKTIDKRVNELLELVGLKGLEKRFPQQLSGGQRQRVAFARAIAPNPQLLLLDEPFAAIDAKIRKELRSWLKDMIEKLAVTSIFVTHDQDEAIEVADEIIIINKGKVEQIGSPYEIYQNPKTAFAASFFGNTAIIDDYGKFSEFEKIENAEKAIVRPEFVVVTEKEKKYASKGVVERTAYRGDRTNLAVRVNGCLITANRELDESIVKAGDEVYVFLKKVIVIADGKVHILKNKMLNE